MEGAGQAYLEYLGRAGEVVDVPDGRDVEEVELPPLEVHAVGQVWNVTVKGWLTADAAGATD